MKSKLSLILILFFATALFAKEDPNSMATQSFAKTNVDRITISLLNTGNWGYWVRYDGQSAHTPDGVSGGFFPRGTAAAIYQDGLMWGGYVVGDPDTSKSALRVGGATYVIGTIQGVIEANGQPANPDAASVKIYRVLVGYKAFENNHEGLRKDAAEFYSKSENEVTAQELADLYELYEYDYMNWPAALGAPFKDVDNNGIYDPAIDIPGLANADQVIWYAVNDLNASRTTALYGSPPIGIELQLTLWAYNQPNSTLGQVVFKKYRFINKSAYAVDSMFVGQWSDPDVGTYTDDLAGCDIEQSIGFAYSGFRTDGDYESYNLPPAAVGYDFFQGPLVDGIAGQDLNGNGVDDADDSGVFDLKVVQGKVNLPMTSFGFFAAGSPISDPTLGELEGTRQWYNLLNGYVPTEDLNNPTDYLAGSGPTRGQATKYPLSGEPLTSSGDIDGLGDNFGPGDRRIVLASGPFTMAAGDTQEVVVAVVGGIILDGGDNRNAVSQMKLNDRFAQFLYNNLFADVPKPPPAPDANFVELEGSIGIDWGSNATATAATEAPGALGYEFEGYNVYQLPSSTAAISEGVKIKTFDIANGIQIIRKEAFLPSYGDIVTVPIQTGTDNGVKRSIAITEDHLTGLPLYNGTTYYFAVTAYNFVNDPTTTEPSLESDFELLAVTPQSAAPGKRIEGSIGQMLDIDLTQTVSDGQVSVEVVNPKLATGMGYEVFFTLDADTNSATYGETVWGVRDENSVVKVSGQLQTATLDERSDQPIFDGIQVKVSGPSPGVKDWDIPQGTRRFTWAGADFGWEGFNGAIGYGSPHNVYGGNPEPLSAADLKDVLLVLAHQPVVTIDYDPVFDINDVNLSYAYRYGRGFSGAAALPEFAAHIVNAVGGYSYQGFEKSVPLSAWDVEDPANPRRLAVAHLENNTAGGLVDGKWWPGSNSSYDNTASSGPREWLFILNETYSETPNPAWQNDLINTPVPIMFWLTVNRRGSQPFSPGTTGDDHFLIIDSEINTVNDIFGFTAPAVTSSADLLKADVKKVNVFPNPYYASNALETSRFNRFVNFVHLPTKATVRIFDLGGTQVRKLEKDGTSQFLPWDLRNENDLPVASGMYIAHIDMGSLGEKVLKIMVIQGQEVLRFY